MVINLMSICRAMSHLAFPSIHIGLRKTASLVKEQNLIVIAVPFKNKMDNTAPILSGKMKM